MNQNETTDLPNARPTGRWARALAIAVAIAAPCAAFAPQDQAAQPPSLEETRVTMAKWIETQQLIGRERNEWNQGKDVLRGRIELVGKEVGTLEEGIRQSEASVAESDRRLKELAAERGQLAAATSQLLASVSAMEGEIRTLAKVIPDPVRSRLHPLLQRIPDDSAATRVSVAERFQNVLGILNEFNKANSEITVAYEVRTLGDGSSAEVQVVYVGLAQAYFVSPRGDAGVGRPTADGWKWEPVPGIGNDVLTALEIIQGKHTPAFVPLPVKIQ